MGVPGANIAATSSAERLQRLLRPRSVALVGGAACAEVLRQCRRIGFEGSLWPIHPSLTEMEGVPVLRCVAQLPQAPDAVFVGVNRHATIEVMAELAASGAGGAVCYASGFAEIGAAGEPLQRQLLAAAGPMPFIGPNCHGLINYADGVALWPEQHGGIRVPRGVAILTQSGNIALNLTMQRRALPIAYLVTLGNQACIGVADAILALLADERVTAIGLHIEGIGAPAAFVHAAQRARARGVPLVAVKSGRSDLGAHLALSHTASLGGSDAVAEAFLERAGVARVHSLPVLLETLKLLHVHGPLAGHDIASMSCSGGEAALAADAALGREVRFRPFTAAQAQHVADTLPPLARPTNPLDYHNFSWHDEQALHGTYAAVMHAAFDLTLLVADFPREDRCSQAGFERALRAFVAASRATGAKGAVVSTLQETFPEERARQLIAAGVAPLCGLEDALSAIAAAARLQRLWLTPAAAPAPCPPLGEVGSHTLSEWQSKRALARCGLKIPAGRKVGTVEDAVAAARAIGYPVALKSVGESITHKTEIGAVRLGLAGDAAVYEAASTQLRSLGAELLVEAMVPDAIAELIVGINRDRALGLYLLLGSGGTLVELIGDRRILMLPATEAQIRAAIESLKIATLLRGHRGRAPGDLQAAVEAVLAIQQYAGDERERLLELDVNPLIVRPRGHGAVAVDALIRLSNGAQHE
jgi:acetate---CoA ligase (ADP-forming)